MKILTSVIGSYPPLDLAGKPVTLEQAVQAQLDAGIDVISTGQLTGNMIEIFAGKIGGIKLAQGFSDEKCPYIVSGALAWPEDGITVSEHKAAGMRLLNNSHNGNEAIRLKGIVTGPYTLTTECNNRFYKSEQELTQAFASVLNKELIALSEVADVLQIDEPSFCNGVPKYIRNVFDTLVKDVKKEIILHAHYGRTTPTDLLEILALPVQTISYDSAANPIVLDLLAKHKVKQDASVGCIMTDGNYLTGVNTIAGRIRRAARILGEGKIRYVTPDCGMRNLHQNTANQIMRRLVAARDSVA